MLFGLNIAGIILFIMAALVCLMTGVFIFLKPEMVISIQKKFYEKINWKIEPISMLKEIRNTKIMGLFLIIFVFLVGIYAVYHPQF